jgi:hypothetical protein
MEMHKRKAIESAQSAADLKLHLEKYHSQIKVRQSFNIWFCMQYRYWTSQIHSGIKWMRSSVRIRIKNCDTPSVLHIYKSVEFKIKGHGLLMRIRISVFTYAYSDPTFHWMRIRIRICSSSKWCQTATTGLQTFHCSLHVSILSCAAFQFQCASGSATIFWI